MKGTMTMSRSGLLAITMAVLVPLISACCSSGRASPPDDPVASEIDQRVRDLLSGYEYVPSPEDWARIGKPEDVSAALIRIAGKPEGQTLSAARATSSLAHFPRPEVATFLEGRIKDPKALATLRGKAAIALAVGFGDEKASVIAPLFANSDEALRDDAIRAFRRLSSPEAERFLDARAKLEPVEHLRSSMLNAQTQIALTRDEQTRAKTYPKKNDELPAIRDPGPIH